MEASKAINIYIKTMSKDLQILLFGNILRIKINSNISAFYIHITLQKIIEIVGLVLI